MGSNNRAGTGLGQDWKGVEVCTTGALGLEGGRQQAGGAPRAGRGAAAQQMAPRAGRGAEVCTNKGTLGLEGGGSTADGAS
jgi:hypothetical protein